MKIPGYTLTLGDEVPPPRECAVDETTGSDRWVFDWQDRLSDAVNAADAWGVIVQRPNMDLRFYDVGHLYTAACGGGTAWLIVGRESPRPPVVTLTEGEPWPERKG